MKELHSDLTKMLSGLNKAADAVGSTLGPEGRNVFISDIYSPRISNDGARIANSISMKDPLEDAGAYLVKNCSAKTNDDVGDGTTTTVVLFQKLVEEALKRPEGKAQVRKSLDEAVKKAVEMLKSKATKISIKDVREVALISGEYPDLADMISEIFNKLGEDALITIEDSKTYETSYELMEGYEAKIGFMSPWFITDTKSNKAIYSDIPVLVSQKKISNVQNINKIVSELAKKGINQCAFFVDDMDERVLAVLVANKVQGKFNSVVVRGIKEELEDIAGATGATLIGEQSGITFDNIELNNLGSAIKLTIDHNSSLIISDPKYARNKALEMELNATNEPNQYRKQKLLERSARLRGKIAVLRIGANNDLAREHKKDKAEDAVKAVPAALSEGLVDGAGKAWLDISKELDSSTIGNQILKRALRAPYEKILSNKGVLDEEEVKVKDPAKVERVALENAAEAAGIFITTAYAITQEEDTVRGN